MRTVSTRARATAIAAVSGAIALAPACALERGWTSKDQNDFRQAVCEQLGLADASTGCECLLNATRAAYPKADDFWNGTEPSIELVLGWRACGIGI